MKRKVSTDTIVRTIVLAIAMVNQILTMSGKNPLPFAEEQIYEALTNIVMIGATIWAWWKNNSITQEAIIADELMKELKATKVIEEVEKKVEESKAE